MKLAQKLETVFRDELKRHESALERIREFLARNRPTHGVPQIYTEYMFDLYSRQVESWLNRWTRHRCMSTGYCACCSTMLFPCSDVYSIFAEMGVDVAAKISPGDAGGSDIVVE